MNRILLIAVCACLSAGSVIADTMITLKPEFSLGADGKAIIVNAKQYCSDATFIFIDTTTTGGKAMYSIALAAHVADKEIHIRTGCTCNSNCSSIGEVPVFKICTVLSNSICE